MKKVIVLGSTGSIGINTLNVIRLFPDKFKVAALTVNTRIDLLEKQIREFKPEAVYVKDESLAAVLRTKEGLNCKVFSGGDSLGRIAAEMDYDIIVGALVGIAGLTPVIEAVKRGKRIALANKETLVVAGEYITELCKKTKAEIIPVDSEHSAIFQCLAGERNNEIEKLILTASGGPFLNKSKSFLSDVTVAEALKHPKWKMGDKITIDSASMMNKGLEVIEAHWLFGITSNKIEVLVHPQSIVHSMVQFIDGSVKAQLGLPDMKLPIQYALTYPERLLSNSERTDFAALRELTFFEPDFQKFECLKLAYEVLEAGGSAPCILNAANEVAVDKFLKGRIRFNRIPEIIRESLNRIENYKSQNLDVLFECDRRTREFVLNIT
jgi:1-deoxy-D-xylulose-5-phosphate reductoisomerase